MGLSLLTLSKKVGAVRQLSILKGEEPFWSSMVQGLPRRMEPGAVIDVLQQSFTNFRFGQVGDADGALADAQPTRIESPVLGHDDYWVGGGRRD